MILTSSQARAFYDRFGRKQDAQAFYENAALDDLVAHAAFERAERVFEFGCETGRLALRLLAKHLSPSASYLGVDISTTMIGIAEQRIAPYRPRAAVSASDGAVRFPLPDRSVDRVVSTYVLDLLSEADVGLAVAEARRVLAPGGMLCLAGLTHGATLASRIVSSLWSAVFRLSATLVGGCRPLRLSSFLDRRDWSVDHRAVVTAFAIPSEVVVASVKQGR